MRRPTMIPMTRERWQSRMEQLQRHVLACLTAMMPPPGPAANDLELAQEQGWERQLLEVDVWGGKSLWCRLCERVRARAR